MLELSSHDRLHMVKFLQDLVRIPSLSGQEKEVGERLAAEMQAAGFDEVRIDRIGNAIGRIGSGKGPIILFNGHMDTVGVGDAATWTRDPFGGTVEGDRLFGRGCADMKGSLAAMVYGLKQLVANKAKLNGTIYLVGAVLEEPCEGLGMRVLVEEEGIKPNWVVLGEPSNMHLCRGHRGRIEIRVKVHGRSCHASTPENGENAIYAASRLMFSMELLATTLAEDSFLGKGTLAITQIESTAGSLNVVPDSCSFIIDRRLTLGETEAKALAEIEGIITREAVRAEVQVLTNKFTSYTGYTRSVRANFPAWVIEESDPLAQNALRSLPRANGYRSFIGRWSFSTDGAYTMGEAGIPTVGFGPGEESQAHTADENISLSECYAAASSYARLAQRMLSRD
jgi:putative selenium metabolism hydrolase